MHCSLVSCRGHCGYLLEERSFSGRTNGRSILCRALNASERLSTFLSNPSRFKWKAMRSMYEGSLGRPKRTSFLRLACPSLSTPESITHNVVLSHAYAQSINREFEVGLYITSCFLFESSRTKLLSAECRGKQVGELFGALHNSIVL